MNQAIPAKRPKQGLKWIIGDAPPHKEIQNLMGDIANLHPTMAHLLLQRGYATYSDVRKFLNPSLSILDELGEMAGLPEAVLRIAGAIDKGEKILVYGDYDVDGTSSVAMMYRFLKLCGADVMYYIPDRYAEGYGLSMEGIEYASANNVCLVITLDCGISAVEKVEKGNEMGLDFIICDHHLPGAVLPPALAILNPKRSDCSYLGKELCGCGVGFILVRALCRHFGYPDAVWKSYLGLVAIATCCDIVPLTGINRALVFAGLEMLRQDPHTGVASLLAVASHRDSLSVSDLVFKIGPRINAAGRLRHASIAAELLITNDKERADELAGQIDKLNNERKKLDKSITAEAVLMMNDEDAGYLHAATVVAHPGWHKGLIGIIASRLTEVCYRPAIVFSETDGMLTGSARGVRGFDLFETLSACREVLVQFGGHQSAAGLTIRKEMLAGFTEMFRKETAKRLKDESRDPVLYIDCALDFSAWHSGVNQSFVRQLKRLGPFGPANMEPVFLTKSCKATSLKVMKEEHLAFEVYQEANPNTFFRVIAFGKAYLYNDLLAGKSFDLVYTVQGREWEGRTYIQLELKDIKL